METLILGTDVGSTTAKVVLTDNRMKVIHFEYVRHHTKIVETFVGMLNRILSLIGDKPVKIAISGSMGMGLAEHLGVPFVQEVLAAGTAAERLYPETRSLIDIGGEDVKLVLFDKDKKPDIRMNGSCAGGTGAYIDQMAALLNVSVRELDELALQSKTIYPIASRCGVFAKIDVQNLISRKINICDVAASIFQAVASQTINALARGCHIEPKLLLCGGPLSYISYLRKAFLDLLHLNETDLILPEHAELFTAFGTALSILSSSEFIPISKLNERLNHGPVPVSEKGSLKALFDESCRLDSWKRERKIIPIPRKEIVNHEECYLGVDSGSTTIKIVITDAKSNLLYHCYKNNDGQPLAAVLDGLKLFSEQLEREGKQVVFRRSAVTGYGEDLIASALGTDYGLVETVAHFLAAQKMSPQVSFILDVGGQDIKAMYVQNRTITRILINEACSSGCGSFLEGFANSLGYNVEEFANLATISKTPSDLGSRCTVFMNSKVKQALRDGATIADLSAGLAYSVVKNCLNKVLKINNYAEIGDNIVVQGGTFRNVAVFRALEILSGRNIVTSDMPELMGAYGAALYAISKDDHKEKGTFVGLENLDTIRDYITEYLSCKGCTNKCRVTAYRFSNGRTCYSGNKCERIFSSNSMKNEKGSNIFEYKKRLIFKRHEISVPQRKLRIGIPRILNMYENFPFWNALFSECGMEVILSDDSSLELYREGNGCVMSDNICFPAKLSHGHLINLQKKGVDRIFYPLAVFERKEFKNSSNSFNCPIVTGYSEVLKSTSLLPELENIPFDSPTINFNDITLLRKACWGYLRSFGVNRGQFNRAFTTAIKEQSEFKNQVRQKNNEILAKAIKNHELLVLVACHPYHIDRLIHQQISQMLSDMGVNVINEEIAVNGEKEGFDQYFAISQWEYPNRILQAAYWVTRQKNDIGFVQLNSFGCGPDAFTIDEINDLLNRTGNSYSLVRIDEISSQGAIKLRLRSLVESLRLREHGEHPVIESEAINKNLAVFNTCDRGRTILVPWFADFYSPLIPALGELAGYKIENLPPSDRQSVDYGLKYANNEICYPATLVVGDMIKALKSGKYDRKEVALGITQTGGQCRATNYIALIRRALVESGYGDVPIIAVAPAKGLHNKQPGFNPPWYKIIIPALMGLFYTDGLARLYYATVCRAKNRNVVEALRKKYLDWGIDLLKQKKHKKLFSLLSLAVEDFNGIEVIDEKVQRIGIVGEIYIKYNAAGQYDVTNWLITHHVEVVLPPLYQFFMQYFVNKQVKRESNLIHSSRFEWLSRLAERKTEEYISHFEQILKDFKFYCPVNSVRHEATLASEILNLANQYGEGWLLPAEIASFSRQGIKDVICMQPFGCIANHIIGKGMEKRIKKLYPEINLLFLDFDAGTSWINIMNRLSFLIQNQDDPVIERAREKILNLVS